MSTRPETLRTAELRVATAIAVASLAAGLAACTTSDGEKQPSSIAVQQVHGRAIYDSSKAISSDKLQSAVWSRHRLLLATWGSGSCPTTPVGLEGIGPHSLRVQLSNAWTEVCTDNLSPTTFVLRLPDSVDDAHALKIDVRGPQGGERRTITAEVDDDFRLSP